MSSYPPTPAFGRFSFVPQKVAVAAAPSNPTDVPPASALQRESQAAPSNTASRRSSGLPSSNQQHHPPLSSTAAAAAAAETSATPVPESAKMNLHSSDDSSDGLEEGELSEPQSRGSVSSGIGLNLSGDEELRPTVDRPPTFEPPGNWNARYRTKPSTQSSRAHPQTSQNRNGTSTRNDRYGAADRKFDPPSQPRGMGDKGRGFLQGHRSSAPGGHAPSHSFHAGAPRPISGYDAVPSHLRQEAQRAILDMRQCGVQYEDLIREGFDPVIMKKLFISMGLPTTDSSNNSAPDLSNGQHLSLPSKGVAQSNLQQSPSDRSDPDKDAQVLRGKLEKERQERERKERQDQERKEAEARAAELVRQREATKQEEERKRREVEVKVKRELAQKKIASMVNHQKPASPGIPPTPISSTPVNAAIVAHPQPTHPAASLAQKIPGLLLGHVEVAPSAPATENTDLLMRDAPVVVTAQPALSAASAEPTGVSQPQPIVARRKRPMAADLYSESNPIRRKFGAQRSNSLIIEVSEDEDEDNDVVGQRPSQEPKEGRKSGTGSPLGTPSVMATGGGGGVNASSRRILSAPSGASASNVQAEALRRKEAEIQRMKEKIMAAQQKKKLSKSAHPTPVATPSIGAGPTVPPPLQQQNGAGKNEPVKTASPAALTKENHTLPADPKRKGSGDDKNKVAEADQARRKEEEQKKQEEKIKAQRLLDEKRRIALGEAEEKRKTEEEAEAARLREKEHNRKRRELMELEGEREKKRLARQKLIAENERLQRQIAEMQKEEQDMEKRHDSLAKDLEEFDRPSQTVAPSNALQNGDAGRLRMEVKVQGKDTEGIEEPGNKPLPSVEHADSVNLLAISETVPVAPTVPKSPAVPPVASGSPNGAPQEPIQTNSDAPEASCKMKAALPVKVSPTPQPVDQMDIDDSIEPPKGHEVVLEKKDTEMESSSGDDEDSSSEDSVSTESTSDEEEDEGDEDEDMVVDSQSEKSLAGSASNTEPTLATKAHETNEPTTAPPQQQGHTLTSAPVDKAEPSVSNVFKPYQSPLAIFKSFRHHPKFFEFNPSGLRSLMYSNHIDPFKTMCMYEVSGGVCNDHTCEWQHFRELAMKDDEILVELAENEGTTKEERERYGDGLRNTIMELKERGIRDFATVARGIATFRRQFFEDETRVVKLQPPPESAFI